MSETLENALLEAALHTAKRVRAGDFGAPETSSHTQAFKSALLLLNQAHDERYRVMQERIAPDMRPFVRVSIPFKAIDLKIGAYLMWPKDGPDPENAGKTAAR